MKLFNKGTNIYRIGGVRVAPGAPPIEVPNADAERALLAYPKDLMPASEINSLNDTTKAAILAKDRQIAAMTIEIAKLKEKNERLINLLLVCDAATAGKFIATGDAPALEIELPPPAADPEVTKPDDGQALNPVVESDEEANERLAKLATPPPAAPADPFAPTPPAVKPAKVTIKRAPAAPKPATPAKT